MFFVRLWEHFRTSLALSSALSLFLFSNSSFSTPLQKDWVNEFDAKFFSAEQEAGLLKGGATQVCASAADRATREAFVSCIERRSVENKKDTERLYREMQKAIAKNSEKYTSPERLDTSLFDQWFATFNKIKKSSDTRYRDRTNGWTHYLSDRIQQFCNHHKNNSCENDLNEVMKPAIDFYPQALAHNQTQTLLAKWRKEAEGDLGESIKITTKKHFRDKSRREGLPLRENWEGPTSKEAEPKEAERAKIKASQKNGTGSPDGSGGFSGKGSDGSLKSCILGFNTQMGTIGGRQCSLPDEGESASLKDMLTAGPEIAKAANVTTDTYFQKLREKAFEKYYYAFIRRFGELPFDGIPADCKSPEYAEITKNAPKLDPSKAISTHYQDYQSASIEITSLQEDAIRFQKEIDAMQDERRKHGKSSKTAQDLTQDLTKMIEYRKNLIVTAHSRIAELVKASPLLAADVDPSGDFLHPGSLPMVSAVAKAVRPDGNVMTADAKLVKGKLTLMDQARRAMNHFCTAQWSDLVRSKELTQEVLQEPGNEIFSGLQKCTEDLLKRKAAHLKVANALVGTGCLAATLAVPPVGGVCAALIVGTSAQHLDHALHEKKLMDACRLAKDAVCDEKEWKAAASELHHAQVHMAIAVAGVGIYAWAEKAEHAAHAIEHVKHLAQGTHNAEAALKTATAVTKSQTTLKGISDALKDPSILIKLGPQKAKALAAQAASIAAKLKPIMQEEKLAGMAHHAHLAEHTYAEVAKITEALKAFGFIIKGN